MPSDVTARRSVPSTGCSTRLMSDPTVVPRSTGSTVPAGSVTSRNSAAAGAGAFGPPAGAFAESPLVATPFGVVASGEPAGAGAAAGFSAVDPALGAVASAEVAGTSELPGAPF